MDDELMDLMTAAAAWNAAHRKEEAVSDRTLRRWCQRGKLQHHFLGGSYITTLAWIATARLAVPHAGRPRGGKHPEASGVVGQDNPPSQPSEDILGNMGD